MFSHPATGPSHHTGVRRLWQLPIMVTSLFAVLGCGQATNDLTTEPQVKQQAQQHQSLNSVRIGQRTVQTEQTEQTEVSTQTNDSTPTNTADAGQSGPATIVDADNSDGRTNSIEVMIADNTLLNDGELFQAPRNSWAVGPFLGQGRDTRGLGTPDYWRPNNSYLKDSSYWQGMTNWWVAYRLVGDNPYANVRLQFRNFECWFLRESTGIWERVNNPDEMWADYYDGAILNFGNGQTPQRPAREGGGIEFKMPDPSVGTNIHGGAADDYHTNISAYNGDLANIAITMEMRLVLDDTNGVNDMDTARIGVSVGGDYNYSATGPDDRRTVYAPYTYRPAIGGSRFKMVTDQWQRITFSPILTSNTQSTLDTAQSSFADRMVAEADFISNPPPFL